MRFALSAEKSDGWRSQFGNAWFFWAQDFTDQLLCGTQRQSSSEALDEKFLRLPYCRQDAAIEDRDALCRRWTYARDYDGSRPTCVWYSYGYSLVLPALQEEWIRGTFLALQSQGLEHELPCSHVQTLPKGVAFAAVHIRCGDIAKRGGQKQHQMLDPAWLQNFLPIATEGIQHIILLGNRNEHSKSGLEVVCDARFKKMAEFMENITNATVHIAPVLTGTLGLLRDIRCMSQSLQLIISSIGSSFGYLVAPWMCVAPSLPEPFQAWVEADQCASAAQPPAF